MSYIAANNDQIYSEYEMKVNRILNSDNLDFLSEKSNVGIFNVEDIFGPKYCEQIQIDFPEIAELFRNRHYVRQLSVFNNMGMQKQFFSYELNTYITPNAARYIYHACVINKYLKEKYNNSEIDIVEIGGGYGGLCYWLQMFSEQIKIYTIIDLPLPCKLQNRCLSILGASSTSITDVNLFSKSNRPLFVISNYAYSEFNKHYQDLYKNTVLKHADGGFMIWNNWTGIYMFTDKSMRIESERPYFENIPNKFIYF